MDIFAFEDTRSLCNPTTQPANKSVTPGNIHNFSFFFHLSTKKNTFFPMQDMHNNGGIPEQNPSIGVLQDTILRHSY